MAIGGQQFKDVLRYWASGVSVVTTAKTDLTLELVDSPEGLGGFFTYSTDLFEAATVAGEAM